MKLRYKKMILLTLMSTMGIGILTLSLAPNNKDSKETMKNEKSDTMAVENSPTPVMNAKLAVTQELSPSLIPTPTSIPTKAPLPVFELEDKGYPEIESLIKDYYDAKIKCDVDKMKTIMSDPSNISTKKQMKEDVRFVEDYKKIKCYVKKGFEDGTYIVYIYNEIKFYNIKTPAPALDKFYLNTDENGKLKIFSGIYDDKTIEYYNARNEDSDVKKLFKDTDEKGEKAKKKDKALKTFWNKLAKSNASSDEDKSSDDNKNENE